MANQHKIPIYLVFIVILTGCIAIRNQTKPDDIDTPVSSLIISSLTVTLSVTPQATPTQPGITSTPTPPDESSATQTPEPSNSIIPICAGKGQIIPPPPDFGITGAIVYQTGDSNGLYTIGGIPLSRGQIVSQQQKIIVYGFSLVGEWLAYAPAVSEENVFHTPVMILLSTGGERIEQEISISGLEQELQDRCVGCQGFHFFDSIGEWINDSLMYMNLGARGNEEGSAYSALPKVLDLLTGDWENQWFNNLPGIYTIFPTRATFHHIKLSPDLSRVLYPADTGGIILRDVVQGVEIWSDGEFSNHDGEEMAWSPDSQMVAVANNFIPEEHRLLLISRDGEVTEIVNYKSPQPGFFAASLTWSPDSQYLAFAVTLDDDGIIDDVSEKYLYMYNAQTKSYLYRCPLPGVIGSYPGLVWSPDNQWIAFREHPLGSMRLLNVQSGEVIELLENAEPVGWSDKFPVEWP